MATPVSARQLDTLNLYFDDFELGDRFTTDARAISEQDVKAFAELTGDHNPLHLDEEFARATRFGDRVVHGMLTLSVTGGLRYPLNGDRLVCLYGIDRIRMVRPVRIGDAVHVEGEVTQLTPKDAGGVVTFTEEVFNQEGERVAILDRSALYRRSPADGQ
jgi:oxepin-CoA hydrolase/3-oxo-5,6-dehydrosuberyl-CoA semialdehyde dehydrogenase